MSIPKSPALLPRNGITQATLIPLEHKNDKTLPRYFETRTKRDSYGLYTHVLTLLASSLHVRRVPLHVASKRADLRMPEIAAKKHY